MSGDVVWVCLHLIIRAFPVLMIFLAVKDERL